MSLPLLSFSVWSAEKIGNYENTYLNSEEWYNYKGMYYL